MAQSPGSFQLTRLGQQTVCYPIGSICMLYMLTKLGFLLMVNMANHIWHTKPDPSAAMENGHNFLRGFGQLQIGTIDD